jgi:predicted alpha-1,2-mannosidase
MTTRLLLLLCLLINIAAGAEKSPADYVDPMLGTSSSRWMLYPGPSMPFGMVKLSPDNTDGEGLNAGYEYTVESLSGFGHAHSWGMGSFLTMPTTGELKITPGPSETPDEGYRSRYRHDTISAHAGYLTVILDDYDIKAELTATTRVGIQRYTFPESNEARILFDLDIPEGRRSPVNKARVEKVSDTEIQGWAYRYRPKGYNEFTLHFVSRFSKPFTSFGGWTGESIQRDTSTIVSDVDQDIGGFVEFSTQAGEVIQVQTGISLVSLEQARLNLDTETASFGMDFDAAHAQAKATWNALMGAIEVSGGSEVDKTKFYTNLYRAYCARTIWSDVNGKYVDMYEKVQQLEDPLSPVYGCDAFWNTFWNLNQLWSLVHPEIANRWAKSLIEINDRGGWLPKGPGGIEYSSIMVASHEIALIVGAYQKGIRNFDVEKAYAACKHNQMEPGRPHPAGGHVGNRQLAPYMELGYVPRNGQVSNTLEYAYDDWCVAQFAKALGKMDDYAYFMKRADNYKNVFDSETGYMRPKHADGSWVDGFNPLVKAVGKEDNFGNKDYIEGNAWQYTWFVPHDVAGLVALMGREEFNRRLDEGFELSRPKFVSQYVNHSNQPNMQAAFLFNHAGEPWKTQKWSRAILSDYYGTGPVDGYPGDEDQGQMGAWFVMTALGLFQMDGGASTRPIYEISSPLFETATIHLDKNYYSGDTFTIRAKNNSPENIYIQSATLNGEALNKPWFYHDELVKGGTLILEMGPEPNKAWGTGPGTAPPSMTSALAEAGAAGK